LNNDFDIVSLYILQLASSGISHIEKEIQKLKEDEELRLREDEMKEAQEKLDLLSEKLHEFDKERKKFDDELVLKTDKIKKNEKRLSSGTITNTKEIISLQEEIVSIKKFNDSIENKVLELLIKIDDLNEELKAEKEKKDKITAHVDNLKNEIDKKIDRLQIVLKKYLNRKEEILKTIPDDYMSKINELVQKKGGIAVGVFKDRMCLACNMEISTGESSKMENANEVFKCPNCRRMLIKYRDKIEDVKKEFLDINS